MSLETFIVQAVNKIVDEGEFRPKPTSLRHCGCCGERAGYTKFKSGPRKGQPDFARPEVLWGMEINRGCGCCNKCWQEALPSILWAIGDQPVEMPEGYPQRFKKVFKYRCTECKWEGLETSVGMVPAAISGEYPGKCPQCGCVQGLFSRKGPEKMRVWEMIPLNNKENMG